MSCGGRRGALAKGCVLQSVPCRVSLSSCVVLTSSLTVEGLGRLTGASGASGEGAEGGELIWAREGWKCDVGAEGGFYELKV